MVAPALPALKFISADSHLVEPADLWQKRLPASLRDRAPHIESRPEGDFFVTPGLPSHAVTGTLGAMIVAKAQGEKIVPRNYRYAEHRPGAYDPHARLADQDLDNLQAEVLYPNWFDLARIPDLTLRAACMRVYNEYLAEFCAVAPDRFLGVAQIPLLEGEEADIERAIAEAQYARDLGLRAVMIPNRIVRPYTHPNLDRLFAALEALDLPVAMHVSTGLQVPFLARDYGRGGISPLATTAKTTGLTMGALELLWSGAAARYPRLRFVLTEGGIGWIAYVLRFADHWWEDHGHYTEPRLDEPPSFYFHRNFWATFEDDRPGILTLPLLNEDHLLWGNDYPHTEGTFPTSRARVAADLGDLPETTRRKLVYDNAAALYGLI